MAAQEIGSTGLVAFISLQVKQASWVRRKFANARFYRAKIHRFSKVPKGPTYRALSGGKGLSELGKVRLGQTNLQNSVIDHLGELSFDEISLR
jgi:hypothetical protein